ncbi:hypothetical protein O9993_21525 [Vibrio lentus]|nr:hypothetical protein [Vibrio lentus]
MKQLALDCRDNIITIRHIKRKVNITIKVSIHMLSMCVAHHRYL